MRPADLRGIARVPFAPPVIEPTIAIDQDHDDRCTQSTSQAKRNKSATKITDWRLFQSSPSSQLDPPFFQSFLAILDFDVRIVIQRTEPDNAWRPTRALLQTRRLIIFHRGNKKAVSSSRSKINSRTQQLRRATVCGSSKALTRHVFWPMGGILRRQLTEGDKGNE